MIPFNMKRIVPTRFNFCIFTSNFEKKNIVRDKKIKIIDALFIEYGYNNV